MKKLFALLAAGLLAVMSGCGGQKASNESKSSAQEPVELPLRRSPWNSTSRQRRA